jgi:ATP-dependent Clp endopeptidase proteolytic subunit ClpP
MSTNRRTSNVTEIQLRGYKAQALEAEAARHLAEARRATLIADEIQHEQERKRASNDEARVFPFYASVGAGSVRACMEMLGEWSRMHSPEDTTDKPFLIEITSPGGSVFDGLALIDYARKLKAEGYVINTFGSGLIASMAVPLLQIGVTRTVGRNSWLMVHEVSDFAIGTVADIEDVAKFNRRLNDSLYSILAERSTLTLAEIKRRAMRRDWYFSADEAVKYGLADEVE